MKRTLFLLCEARSRKDNMPLIIGIVRSIRGLKEFIVLGGAGDVEAFCRLLTTLTASKGREEIIIPLVTWSGCRSLHSAALHFARLVADLYLSIYAIHRCRPAPEAILEDNGRW